MKVHEQEWHVCDLDHRVVENAEDMVVADIRVPPHDGGEDVAHFIAAAPDMARVLLRRLNPEIAPCLCHLTAPLRCNNCEDRDLLVAAGVLP